MISGGNDGAIAWAFANFSFPLFNSSTSSFQTSIEYNCVVKSKTDFSIC